MKNLSLCLAFFAIVGVLIANVESSSPRRCPPPGECGPCEQVNCECGTYRDQCDCCDLCMKCKGAACQVVASDVCEEGYICGDPTRNYLERVNHPATCIRNVWDVQQ